MIVWAEMVFSLMLLTGWLRHPLEHLPALLRKGFPWFLFFSALSFFPLWSEKSKVVVGMGIGLWLLFCLLAILREGYRLRNLSAILFCTTLLTLLKQAIRMNPAMWVMNESLGLALIALLGAWLTCSRKDALPCAVLALFLAHLLFDWWFVPAGYSVMSGQEVNALLLFVAILFWLSHYVHLWGWEAWGAVLVNISRWQVRG